MHPFNPSQGRPKATFSYQPGPRDRDRDRERDHDGDREHARHDRERDRGRDQDRRHDRSDRYDRNDRNDRNSRNDRGNRNDRSERNNRNDRGGARKSGPPKVILDLSKHADQRVLVRLAGGREVTGVLKGWDPLLNVVLDDAVEQLRDAHDAYKLSGATRKLGLLVARGTSVMTISPVDGVEQIDNPFAAPAPDQQPVI